VIARITRSIRPFIRPSINPSIHQSIVSSYVSTTTRRSSDGGLHRSFVPPARPASPSSLDVVRFPENESVTLSR